MKKNPASIEENANASAQKARADSANAAENIFHSNQPATENNKETRTMKTKSKVLFFDGEEDLDKSRV